MDTIKIFICDDSVALCKGYHMFIDAKDDMEFAGEAHDSETCLREVQTLKPDLLLLDIQMESERAGINILPVLKEKVPDMKIIMLTGYENSQYVFKSILNGADGYILKQIDGEKMLDEVKKVYLEAKRGKKEFDFMQSFKSEALAIYDNLTLIRCVMNEMIRLTAAEYEILKMIYEGNTYKKIAQQRFVEECTIKTTASRILKKLNVPSMKQLINVLKDIHFFDSLK